jgi:hypothetical protein
MERGFGMGSLLSTQTGLWPEMGNAAALAAGLYQRQNRFTGQSGTTTATKGSSRKKYSGAHHSMVCMPFTFSGYL